MSNRLKFSVVITSSAIVIVLLAGSVLGQNAQPEDAYRHLAVYTEVLSRIKSDYVEEPDMKSVTLGALNGLLESLDPYSSYLSADQYKQYIKLKDSQPGDVGLLLSKRFGYLGVVGVAPGSAAAKAGINTGDVVEAIKGVTTRDMPLAYADVMLHGEPGSTVEVTVLRVRRSEPQKFTLTRAVLKPAPVVAKMLPDQIGHVQVQSLAAGKADETAAALRDLEKQGARKLVLDLRGNAGGLADQGIALANLFLDKGLITYLQGQKTGRQNFDADPAKVIFQHPMVAIVNRGTSGGAEIAVSALLDHKRAEVVGERSYGDAALRKTVMTDDGAAVILSVAKYYSPTAKSIQDQGVTPTVPMAEVEPFTDPDDDQQERPEPAEPKKTEDNLLKKAVEILTKGVERAASPSSAKPNEARDPSLGPLNIPKPTNPR